MVLMACSKSAPVLSILLMNASRGTWYLSAWRQTVSDCGCTPATASKIATAPSRTRSERSTSTVKSTWPGVSIMLTRNSVPFRFQGAFVARPNLVRHARVKQDAFGRSGLAGVDMRDDADVTCFRELCLACHFWI